MNKLQLHRRESHELIDDYLDDGEIEAVLESISLGIGRIVIEFNSLEDYLEFCIKEIVSNSERGDDQIYVFLAEMSYRQKVEAYVNLCGQTIRGLELEESRVKLKELAKRLGEAADRRNEYAHGGWTGISSHRYVRVKTRAARDGVYKVYRKFDEATMAEDLLYIRETTNFLIEFDNAYWGEYGEAIR